MKKRITLRIDEDVLEWFRSKGRGYQGRINDVLKSHFLLKTGRGYHDVEEYYKEEYYKDDGSGTAKVHPERESYTTSTNDKYRIGVANATVIDQFFKPMPKPEKGKKPRCRP